MGAADGLPRIPFASSTDWEQWLEDDHATAERRTRSNWSRINRERAERLISEGRMRPAGLAEIDRARTDGRWDAANESPEFAATVG